MNSRFTSALMVGAIVVAAIGSGVAVGASSHSAVKACSSKSGHRLGLIHHGKCAAGFKKVTLGARGPRGARGQTGPQGPGATSQRQTDPNNDLQQTLEHDVAGIRVHSTCGMAANVSIEIEPASGTGTIEAYGTRSQDAVLNVVSQPGVPNFSATGNADAAIDVVARAGNNDFVDLRVSGFWANNQCTITEVAVPTTPAT
jgi:hypothetical protein